jgi:site-specific DNA-methyltransferase (adenine-specific)
MVTVAPLEADALDIPLTPPPGGEVLYRSDRCTLVWGDCRDPAVIASVPAGYGLLCTDPPYGVNYRSSFGGNFTVIQSDDGSVDWAAVLAEWVGPEGTTTRGLAESRHVYVFGYSPDQLRVPLRLGGTAELIWDKAMTGMGNLSQPWGPAHEVIAFGVHGKRASGRTAGKGNLSARLRQGSVLRVLRPNADAVIRHPTEKPVALMSQLIESSTVRGDLVVDPCAGSGSTLVAAILEGRRGFGVEIDRKYAELAVTRIKAAGKIADQIERC